MLTVTSQDLQKQVGDVQMQAWREPVLITSHGKPRCVLLSIQEFSRLKLAAGETVPPKTERKALTYRAKPDPLGYGLADFDRALSKMVADAASGHTKDAIDIEYVAVRRRLGRTRS